MEITATGSAGQTSWDTSQGGSGDVVSGTLSGLSSGEQLDVCVDYGGGAAGASEDGVYSGSGGGASGVSLGPDFSTPVLIAAGGGGGGPFGYANGGGAGLPVGGAGGTEGGIAPEGGGGGGTQSQGGASGEPGCTECSGAGSSSAGPGTGGAGGGAAGVRFGGGGGGAGYYGGGGGAGGELNDGGGGGGSDFCASSLPAPASLSGCGVTGTNSTFGTASVTLTYTTASAVAGQLVTDSAGKGPGKALADKAAAIQTAVNSGHTATACAETPTTSASSKRRPGSTSAKVTPPH